MFDCGEALFKAFGQNDNGETEDGMEGDTVGENKGQRCEYTELSVSGCSFY